MLMSWPFGDRTRNKLSSWPNEEETAQKAETRGEEEDGRLRKPPKRGEKGLELGLKPLETIVRDTGIIRKDRREGVRGLRRRRGDTRSLPTGKEPTERKKKESKQERRRRKSEEI